MPKDILQKMFYKLLAKNTLKLQDDKYLIKVDHAYKMLVADYSKFQKYAMKILDFSTF